MAMSDHVVDLQEALGLNPKDLEQFRHVSSELLAHTFILRTHFVKDGEKQFLNPDYLFVQKYFEVLYQYFALMNWQLRIDDYFGYCFLVCESSENRLNLTKEQTGLFLCLRLLYDEKMNDLDFESDVIVSIQDILDKLIGEFGLLKTYSKQKMKDDLSVALRFRVIQKIKGALNSAESLFVIMPSVLAAVPSDRVHSLVKNFEKVDVDEMFESSSPD